MFTDVDAMLRPEAKDPTEERLKKHDNFVAFCHFFLGAGKRSTGRRFWITAT